MTRCHDRNQSGRPDDDHHQSHRRRRRLLGTQLPARAAVIPDDVIPRVTVDFQLALLWLRSIEIVVGHPPALMLSELNLPDLFGAYTSPIKA